MSTPAASTARSDAARPPSGSPAPAHVATPALDPSAARRGPREPVAQRVTLSDGVRLELLELHPEIPDPGALPLLLLHGFTGAAATWAELLPILATHRRVIALSLPGHGASDAPADPARYAASRAAADLVELMDRLRIPRAMVLGYSMGGRVALHLALAAPERVGALVLESASPGITDPGERDARRAADEALAEELELEGIEAFVDRWERLPLWASQCALPEEVRARLRAQRLASSAHGLAGSLRGLGAGATPPVHHRLEELRAVPTLLIAGALDVRYVALAREMRAALPRATLHVVEGAGHAVHLERPHEMARAVVGGGVGCRV